MTKLFTMASVVFFCVGQEYHSCQVNDPLHEAESYLKSVGSDADVSVKLSLETAHKLNLHPVSNSLSNRFILSSVERSILAESMFQGNVSS